MRNLVLILIAFIAVVTFIRAFDKPGEGIQGGGFKDITEFNSSPDTLGAAGFESALPGAESPSLKVKPLY
jgi:hypothetical protein